MNRRSVLLLLATLVAVIGAFLVFLYVKSADNRATQQYDTVRVLRAVEAIEPGESIDAALAAGKIQSQPVPRNQLVDGYLTSTESIKGLVATTRIYPKEQIMASKFGGQVEQSVLAIPKGMQAVSIELSDPDRVAGFVSPGSEVALYHQQVDGDGAGQDGRVKLLLKRVLVLGVGSSSTTTKTTTQTDGGQQTTEVPQTLITVAVTQADAEKIWWAESESVDHGEVSMALLNDDSETRYTRGTSFDDLYYF